MCSAHEGIQEMETIPTSKKLSYISKWHLYDANLQNY